MCRICYPPALASLRQLLAHIACLSSVKTLSIDFMSPRTWNGTLNFDNLRNLCLSCVQHEPGLCVLPSLPLLETLSLNFCCYCLECPKNGCGPCTKIQFDELPRLVHLSISGAQTSNVVCSGTAHRLSKLHIDDSDGLILSTVLVCVGVQLEEISIWNCDFEIDASVSLVAKSGLKSVRIFDSRSSLCLLHLAEISSTACFDIRIHPNDFERLEDWPRIMRLLRIHRVILSLNNYEDLQLPLNKGSRLWQVISLPNVQLERGDWLWLLACHRGCLHRKELFDCAMANFVALEDFAAMGGQLSS